MNTLMTILRSMYALLLKGWSPVSLVLPWLAPVSGLFAMVAMLSTMADDAATKINALAAQIQGFPVASMVAFANYMFPVGEALAILGTLLGLRVVCAIVRMVKSWVPTVS